MLAITLLLLTFNMAMNTGKGSKGLVEEASRAIEKLEDEPKLSAPPPQIPHYTGSVFVGPHTPGALHVRPHSSHPYGINSEVKYGLYPDLSNPAHFSAPNKHYIKKIPLVQSSELKNVGNGAGKFSLKRLTRKQKLALGILFGLITSVIIDPNSIKISFSLGSGKIQNSTLLTPDNANSTILNNAYSTANITEQTANMIEMNVNKELAQTMSETLAANTKQSSDPVTAHGYVHIEHTHTMHKLAVYIAVTTLLIAACILALHMVKLYRQDVVTDMQQYYTGASTAMQSNMNVPLHQHSNLI